MKKLFSFLRPRTQARDRESDGDGKPSMPRAAANRAPPGVHGEGHDLRRGSALGGGADPKEHLPFTRRPRAGDKNAAHNKFFL